MLLISSLVKLLISLFWNKCWRAEEKWRMLGYGEGIVLRRGGCT
jgi:hypothetical protein